MNLLFCYVLRFCLAYSPGRAFSRNCKVAWPISDSTRCSVIDSASWPIRDGLSWWRRYENRRLLPCLPPRVMLKGHSGDFQRWFILHIISHISEKCKHFCRHSFSFDSYSLFFLFYFNISLQIGPAYDVSWPPKTWPLPVCDLCVTCCMWSVNWVSTSMIPTVHCMCTLMNGILNLNTKTLTWLVGWNMGVLEP